MLLCLRSYIAHLSKLIELISDKAVCSLPAGFLCWVPESHVASSSVLAGLRGHSGGGGPSGESWEMVPLCSALPGECLVLGASPE